jgi:hypothetical protein
MSGDVRELDFDVGRGRRRLVARGQDRRGAECGDRKASIHAVPPLE